MKRLYVTLIGLLLCGPSLAHAGGVAITDDGYQGPVAVDTLVHTGYAYVKWMECNADDNLAVAGTIQLRDAVAAGAGTVVKEWAVLAVDYSLTNPKIFPVNAMFRTGVFLDFTTTTDVKCNLSLVK